MNEEKTEMYLHETYYQAHSWYEEQLKSFYEDILRLKNIQQQPNKTILPKYVELSNSKLYIQSSYPAGKPLTKYNKSLFGKNYKQLLAIILSCIETGVYVHQTGCVMRQFTTQNLFLCKTGYHVLAYFQETVQNTLTVQCPPEYCTDSFYNYNVYTDDLKINNLVQYRKFLAFPAELRFRQRIYFTINTDIYSLGALMYNIITTKAPLSPYECQDMSDLKTHAIQMQHELKTYNLPEAFVKVILKMLFLYENNYFYNFVEIHNTISQIITGQIQTKGMTFQQFKKAIAYKTQHNITNERILIDHLSNCIKFQMLQKMDLKTYKYECNELFDLSEYPNFNVSIRNHLQQFCEKNARQNLWQVFYSDNQGVLGVLQGYPGAGKTQMALSIMNFFAKRMIVFSCYIPLKRSRWDPGIAYSNPPYLPARYCQTQIIDFYHYILLYLLYNVEQLNISPYIKAIEKTLSQENDANKIRMLAPAFCDAVNIALGYWPINITEGVTKEMLIKILYSLQSISVIVFIVLDDFQSGIHRQEADSLLEIILAGPRVSVLMTECPGVLLEPTAFGFPPPQTSPAPLPPPPGIESSSANQVNQQSTFPVRDGDSQSDFIQKKNLDGCPSNFSTETQSKCKETSKKNGFSYISEVQSYLAGMITTELSGPTTQTRRPQRMTRKTISDIVSVGSATSEVVNTNTDGRAQTDELVDIRVRTYIIEKAAQLGLKKVQNIAAQELNMEGVEEVIRKFGLSGGSNNIMIMRSTDIKNIHHTMLQLFQHSAMLPNGTFLEQTLAMCVADELFTVVKYLRNQGAFSPKDIELLQACALLGTFIEVEFIYVAMSHLRKEAVQSALTRLSTIHGYALGAATPNVRLRHAQFPGDAAESVFYWHAPLLRKIFYEALQKHHSQKQLNFAHFLLQKYRMQFSFTETRIQRKQLFLPRYETDALAKRLLDSIVEDVEVETGNQFKKDCINMNSSLVRMMSRKTQSRLLTEEQDLIQHHLDESSYYLQADGLFITLEMLVSVLSSLQTSLPDIFDQLEILQLTLTYLKSVQFGGQIPIHQLKYFNVATLLFNECQNWLKLMTAEVYTPFASSRFMEALSQLEQQGRISKIRNYNVIVTIQEFYKVFASAKQQLLELSVLQQRHEGFARIKQFVNYKFDSQTQQLFILNKLIEQLIMDVKLNEARTLCIHLYTIIDADAFTIQQTKQQLQALYYDVMGQLKDIWSNINLFDSYSDDQYAKYENEVQNILHYLVHIYIQQNNKIMSLIYSLLSIQRAVKCQYMSVSTLINLYFLYLNYQSFGISQSNALKYVKQMKKFNNMISDGELKVSNIERLQLQLFYFCTRADIKEPTQFEESQFLYEMSIGLVNIRELKSCWQLQVVIPWFFVHMDMYERHTELALLVQQLIKELTNVGQWCLVEFLAVVGQCALDKMGRLDGCDISGTCGKRHLLLDDNEARQLMRLIDNKPKSQILSTVVAPKDGNYIWGTSAACILLNACLCESKIKAAEVSCAVNVGQNGFLFSNKGKLLKARVKIGTNARDDLKMLYSLKYKWTKRDMEAMRNLYALYKEMHSCE